MRSWSPGCVGFAAIVLVGCADDSGGRQIDTTSTGTTSADPTGGGSTLGEGSGSSGLMMDLGDSSDVGPPPDPPMDTQPCDMGSCWYQLTFGGVCGACTIDENFGTGLYNVHAFELSVRAEIPVELSVTVAGGVWEPALVIHDEMDVTIYDGVNGAWQGDVVVEAIDTGQGSDQAAAWILAEVDMTLTVFVTGWDVVSGGFAPSLPMDAVYELTVENGCAPPAGLESPPNFDANDVVGGYYLLPESEPAGLYTRKGEACSRGNKKLIDVLYTVAKRWNEIRPGYSPIEFRDLNENIAACETNHMTHDMGIDADLIDGCATDVDCADWIPAVELAKLFIQTGEVCGILFNDDRVQSVINPYFESRHDYEPWNAQFMRTVSGHTQHMHVRVKNDAGTCN